MKKPDHLSNKEYAEARKAIARAQNGKGIPAHLSDKVRAYVEAQIGNLQHENHATPEDKTPEVSTGFATKNDSTPEEQPKGAPDIVLGMSLGFFPPFGFPQPAPATASGARAAGPTRASLSYSLDASLEKVMGHRKENERRLTSWAFKHGPGILAPMAAGFGTRLLLAQFGLCASLTTLPGLAALLATGLIAGAVTGMVREALNTARQERAPGSMFKAAVDGAKRSFFGAIFSPLATLYDVLKTSPIRNMRTMWGAIRRKPGRTMQEIHEGNAMVKRMAISLGLGVVGAAVGFAAADAVQPDGALHKLFADDAQNGAPVMPRALQPGEVRQAINFNTPYAPVAANEVRAPILLDTISPGENDEINEAFARKHAEEAAEREARYENVAEDAPVAQHSNEQPETKPAVPEPVLLPMPKMLYGAMSEENFHRLPPELQKETIEACASKNPQRLFLAYKNDSERLINMNGNSAASRHEGALLLIRAYKLACAHPELQNTVTFGTVNDDLVAVFSQKSSERFGIPPDSDTAILHGQFARGNRWTQAALRRLEMEQPVRFAKIANLASQAKQMGLPACSL